MILNKQKKRVLYALPIVYMDKNQVDELVEQTANV